MKDISDIVYDIFMYPMEALFLNQARKKILKNASGDVLEIGAGTGVNFKYYDFTKITSLMVSDKELSKKITGYKFPNDIVIGKLDANVEKLDLEENSVDSVVFTLVFCSVDNPLKGLKEIKRVLKPNGRIYFIEHVLPVHNPMKGLFNFINPKWSKIAGGCNLNRETHKIIEDSGFQIENLDRFMGAFIAGTAIIK